MKLVATVLAPTVLGMAIRASHPRVRRWIAHHKTKLSLFSTFNLVMIIWQTLSAARGVLLRQSAAHLVLVAVAAISQHLIYLAFNWVVATRVLNPPPAEAVAVVIMGGCVCASMPTRVCLDGSDHDHGPVCLSPPTPCTHTQNTRKQPRRRARRWL